MSIYKVVVNWSKGADVFTDRRYSRAHVWRFDGGLEVPASSSPSVVPLPMSVAAAVDPEEAFVASLSSCHMLWFLDLACRAGHVVERYVDEATGEMGRDASGRIAMLRVTLHPKVQFAGASQPDMGVLERLHHSAHESCFIANSVKTEVVCEPAKNEL
jgi:organic hydroperoxide reductase OsmC/OhrA